MLRFAGLVLLGGCAGAAPTPADSAQRDLARAPAGAPPLPAAARRPVTPCLAYEDTSDLMGTLRREVHPGPPNFEDTAAGDEARAGFFLHLASPICVRTAWTDSAGGDDEPRDSVLRIQLVLDSAGYARLRPRLGRLVTVRGTLFSSHTGYHHAPVLLLPAEAP